MQIEENTLQAVSRLLEENREIIAQAECRLPVGCSFCGLGCSGIVGG